LHWKDQPFSWGVETDNAYQSLKASFTTTPLLMHVDPSKHFVLEMDAFDFVAGTMLSLGKSNLLHPIAFCFHKFFSCRD
jgi:hypothetical protein